MNDVDDARALWERWEAMGAASRLRAWMAADSIGLKALADELSCSEDAITDWRSNRRVPSLVQRRALERRSAGWVPAELWERELSEKRRVRKAERELHKLLSEGLAKRTTDHDEEPTP